MRFKAIVLKISFLWVDGMAIFPFIFVKKSKNDSVLLNHELIHLRQQLEMGIFLFYGWYLLEYTLRLIAYQNHFEAYYNISFEREAFRNEHDLEYIQKRSFWQFLKYLKA